VGRAEAKMLKDDSPSERRLCQRQNAVKRPEICP